MNKKSKDYLIVALDTSSEMEALKTIDLLSSHVNYFKVGLELFCTAGPKIIDEVKNRGNKVFFDGKFLDIPNTVSKAVSSIVRHRVDMLNVHITGASEMISEAKQSLVEAANKYNLNPPALLGVTILTSMNQETLTADLQIKDKIENYILHLTKLGIKSGLDGVVCSPNEAKMIRDLANKEGEKDFLIVTPGVRPTWAKTDDQQRISTPKDAILNGVSHIVVGRPITAHENPVDATKKILEEIEEAIT